MVTTTKAVQNAHAERWTRLQRAATDRRVQFRISLATAKTDAELEEIVSALSDVTSPSYGQYLRSSAELAAHWAPHKHATEAFERLAASVSSLNARPNAVGDLWTLDMHAGDAERLFATELYEFAHHRVPGLTVVRPADEYTVPASLADHIVYVDGLESFPTEMQAQYMARGVQNGDPYAIKQHQAPTTSLGKQRERSVVTPAIVREQYDIPTDAAALNASHALNKLVIGTFLHEFYTETDLQTFLGAYDPAFAPHATHPTARGDCIAGRPGSMATRATGEASLDIQVAATIARSDNVEMLCYTGLRDDSRPQAADNQEPFLTFLLDVNAMDPPPAVVSISYTDDECSVPTAYALAVNRELMKAAMKGMTVLISAGDAGSRGSHLAGFCGVRSCSQFLANFPASSPYVTAVGATTIDLSRRDGRDGKYREVVTSTTDGALITSGGGFSVLFSRPAYQDTAVAAYLQATERLAPFFNTHGRAYPDITGLGHAFPVVENSKMYPTDGTSVSAPLLASMVALANKRRLEAGKPVLGFLNPLLYQLHAVCPHVFVDITDGDTSCGTPDMGCCPTGHVATEGWDAASGVGTMRFRTFVDELDQCIALIQSSSGERQGPFAPPINLLAASDGFTASQRSAHTVLLSVALIAGVALVSVLAALRATLFRTAADARTRFHANVREPAREYLLAHDQRRV